MNGLTSLLLGWNTNRQKRFVNVFACEMSVKVQIALKFSNLSIVFLKFPRFSKILFYV